MIEIEADGTVRNTDKHTVADIPDAALLERAVRGARSDRYGRRKHMRWVAVSEKFSLGSTYAHQLCRRFNLNPDEEVRR
jgi:hypothetical protein